MKINNIVILLLCIGMIYVLFFKKEKMTADANTKKLIQDHYKIDVDAIRNLSLLANDLTKNGKLRIPGGLEVDGELTVKKRATFPHELVSNGVTTLNGLTNCYNHVNMKKDLQVNGTSTFNGPTNFKNQKTGHATHLNQPDGNIYLRGNVIIDGHGNSGKDLHVHGESKFHKPTWFQNQKKPNVWSHMNWGDGKAYFRGDVVMDGNEGTGKDLHVPHGTIHYINHNKNNYKYHYSRAIHGHDRMNGITGSFRQGVEHCDGVATCGGVLYNKWDSVYHLKNLHARNLANRGQWSENHGKWAFAIKK